MKRRLFLLRHGEAVVSSPDRQRSLSLRGQQQTAAAIDQKLAVLRSINAVVCSPYRRARQTAQIAKDLIGFEPAIMHSPLLYPEADPQKLFDWLQQGVGDCLLVGHNPQLSDVLNRLVGYQAANQRLDTSSLAAIELEVVAAGCGDLLWLLHRH